MNVFLLKKNQDGLIMVIDHLADTNVQLNKQVYRQLEHYKNTRRDVKNKTQLRLYFRSIQHLKDNMTTDLAINLLTFRMRQFTRWFTYMWGNPSLTQRTYNRLSTRFPYKKTHFLRKNKIIK